MDAVTPISSNVTSNSTLSTSQELENTDLNQADASGATEGVEDDFSSLMLKMMGKSDQDQVNEEELYSAIIEKRLEALRPEAAEAYRTAKATQLQNFTRTDGYTYVEKASLAALKDLVANGTLTEDEGMQVNGEAFAAAQLDDNHEMLFDSRGGGEDQTIATSSMAEALFNLQTMLGKVSSGEMKIDPKELEDPQPDSGMMVESDAMLEELDATEEEADGDSDDNGESSFGQETGVDKTGSTDISQANGGLGFESLSETNVDTTDLKDSALSNLMDSLEVKGNKSSAT